MIDYRELENLIKALDKSSLTNLEVESEGIKISLSKEASEKVVYLNGEMKGVPSTSCSNVESSLTISSSVEEVSEESNLVAIKSPIVGTFYSKPAPDKDAYVSEGDSVKKGQVVCIIEAMKLMNEVKSDFTGEIVKVLANDGDLIEYGQEIFLIKEN
ncbi:MAG: acetyl-CoA carboxylase biotin carboxyl carrier protein [Clostridium sp.]|uniref:acetyl-CoA carboxylase biotin carboxyl carrier protein n=1 Tax=Clostridium sp. TaxID=1506 RepID=UPI002FC666D5